MSLLDDLTEPTVGHPDAPLVTPTRLAEMWPYVSRRLFHVLHMRGLPACNAEDLVQEVCVRAMTAGVRARDREDFLRWALPVTRNLHVDLIRAQRRLTPVADLPDREGAILVEHEVERRQALEAVLNGMAQLTEQERDAVLAAAQGEVVDGATAATTAVRRHRGRARLRLLAEGFLGVSGIGALARRARVLSPSAPSAFSMLVVPVVVGIAAIPSPTGSAGVVARRAPRYVVEVASATVPRGVPVHPVARRLRALAAQVSTAAVAYPLPAGGTSRVPPVDKHPHSIVAPHCTGGVPVVGSRCTPGVQRPDPVGTQVT